jgi:threonyl-tRNA synthetase
MGKKIRNAKQAKLPYLMVVGDKEMAEQTVTLEKRDGTSETMSLNAAANHLLAEHEAKTL